MSVDAAIPACGQACMCLCVCVCCVGEGEGRGVSRQMPAGPVRQEAGAAVAKH